MEAQERALRNAETPAGTEPGPKAADVSVPWQELGPIRDVPSPGAEGEGC